MFLWKISHTISLYHRRYDIVSLKKNGFSLSLVRWKLGLKGADFTAIYYSNRLTSIIEFPRSIAILNASSDACCWKDMREDSIDYDRDVTRWSGEETIPSVSATVICCSIIEVIVPWETRLISKTVHKKARLSNINKINSVFCLFLHRFRHR